MERIRAMCVALSCFPLFACFTWGVFKMDGWMLLRDTGDAGELQKRTRAAHRRDAVSMGRRTKHRRAGESDAAFQKCASSRRAREHRVAHRGIAQHESGGCIIIIFKKIKRCALCPSLTLFIFPLSPQACWGKLSADKHTLRIGGFELSVLLLPDETETASRVDAMRATTKRDSRGVKDNVVYDEPWHTS